MADLISPGVLTTEQDQTNVVPAVATTPGATVILAQWGPVLESNAIDSENNLVDRFLKPTTSTFAYFFTAANFLRYGATMNVVRVCGAGTTNSSTTPTASFNGTGSQTIYTLPFAPLSAATITVTVGSTVLTPTTQYTVTGTTLTFAVAPAAGTANISVTEKQKINNESQFSALTSLPSSAYAKFPGSIGNSLKVILATATTYTSLTTGEKAIFDGAPSGTEIHFAVIDEDGSFTGTAGILLERKQYLSTVEGTKFDNGESQYYKEWVNRNSDYVYVNDLTAFSAGKVSLVNGVDDYAVTSGDLTAGYDLFISKDAVDVSLIPVGPVSSTVAAYVINNVAAVRQDCMVFASPDLASVLNNTGQEVTNITTYRTALGSTSYAVMDCNWKLQYDAYNDTNRWVPLNGDIAGVTAYTDDIADPWVSPAGYNRGGIKNVIRLAWNPSQTDRDNLYKNSINPVITVSGRGTFLFGDKTLLTRPSAFDRINVRRMFITIEKAISAASQYMLFELNTEFTRARFRNLVEPYLRDVQGRQGIADFKVVADTTNNTDQVISSNKFVADIYIKPTYSINYITLNFIATRDSVNFTETAA